MKKKMDCDVFLWRFVTFNEISYMKSGRPLVGMRALFSFKFNVVSFR